MLGAPMPKAAVDEDREFRARKKHVGPHLNVGLCTSVNEVSKAATVQNLANRKFAICVALPNLL